MSQISAQIKKLSPAVIEESPEIQRWVGQFPNGQRATAKLMLSHLQFVSRDVYSTWLRKVINGLPAKRTYALYSVRKLPEGSRLWDDAGAIVSRPGESLGSEDLVYSLVASLTRARPQVLLDHPSLAVLRSKKVHDYVLIDDSIGSGDRVFGFINSMLSHPTFLSWWSFGFVRIHVVSFARPREAEAKVIAKVKGSDHGMRKYRKSSKIGFTSEIVYEANWLEARWGENYEQIVELSRSLTKLPKWARLGYGDVFANIVFDHSVPNNLPGALWYTDDKWRGLMPGRSLPDWLLNLLDQPSSIALRTKSSISAEMGRLLALVKKGIRCPRSIAARLTVDHKYAVGLLANAQSLGLLTARIRLTPAGLDQLKRVSLVVDLPVWDRSMYIPNSWCAGRATVQPSTKGVHAPLRLTDSVEFSDSTDGDVGQTSLGRSDAKAATPPFSVMLHSPSVSRKDHDTDGPMGSKDR